MNDKQPIVGRRIGRITIVGRTTEPQRWLAKCDCGHEISYLLTRSDVKRAETRTAKGIIVECGMCGKARQLRESQT